MKVDVQSLTFDIFVSPEYGLGLHVMFDLEYATFLLLFIYSLQFINPLYNTKSSIVDDYSEHLKTGLVRYSKHEKVSQS